MTQDLKPYPAYKDSRAPWLGQVPEHWAQLALWTVSTRRAERNPGNLPLLSVFLNLGVIPYEQGGGQVHAPSIDLSSYQLVQPGDFVLNNQQAWRGSVGVSRYRGIISPAYIVLRLSTRLEASFANYLMRSPRMVDQFVVASKGVGDIQRQIYWPYLRLVQVPLPPLPEQAAIVRFLDHYDHLIRRYLRAKRKLIALLNEQKQAIIHRAVTRGLDPSVRLKPSGVEWLGDIPEHWEVVPNRSLMSPRKQIVGDRSGEFTLLSLTLRGIVPRDLDNPQGKFPSDFATYQVVEPADLVFCLFDMDETPRTVGMATVRGMVTGAYTVFHCSDPDTARFLHLFYESLDELKGLRPFYTGLRKVVRTSTFLSIRVAIPPKNELSQILSLVALEITELETAIGRVQREINLVREYRARLIVDVVTGKLDVREASANLPEEPEETEELEEAESADGEFEDEEAGSEADTAEVLA